MPVLSKVAFGAGEVTPAVRTRVDSNAQHTGLRTLRNGVVRKSGGVRNRAGLRYVATCFDTTSPKRLVEFDFGGGDAYALVFGGQDIRFYRDRIQVRETAKEITGITQASPGVFTCAGHALSDGDEIYLEGEEGMVEVNKRSFLAAKIDADTFSVTDFRGLPIDTTNYTAFSGGCTFARTYHVGSPYSPADLPALSYAQTFDVMKLASIRHPMQDLIRSGNANWAISNSSFGPSISAPTGLAVDHSGSAVTFAVTAVKDSTGEESLAATIQAQAPTSGTPVTVSWTAVSGAVFYLIYRDDGDGIYGLVGLAGAGASPSFKDKGFGPDDTKTPKGVQGAILNFGFKLDQLDDTDFPVTALPGDGRAIAWSPAGDLVAVGSASADYLLVYLYQAGVFTLISAIGGSDLPTGTVNALAWSPDGQYLAAAVSPASGSTRAFLYKRTGQTLALVSPSSYTQPTGNAFGVAWSSDSNLVAWAHATTPYVTVHQRSGSTFTKIANPSTLPTAQANCVAFTPGAYAQSIGDPQGSPTTVYEGYGLYPNAETPPFSVAYNSPVATIHGLVVGHNNSGGRALTTYMIVPQHQSSTVNLLYYSGITQPGQNVLACSIPQGAGASRVLTIGLAGGAYLKCYTIGPDPVAQFYHNTLLPEHKLLLGTYSWPVVTNPVSAPDGAVNGIADTQNGNYCVLATSGTVKLLAYSRIANVLVRIDDTLTDIGNNGRAASWSPDNGFLGVAFDTTTPYAAMYENSVIHPAVVGFGQQRLRMAQTSDSPDIEYDSAQNAFTDFAVRPLANDRDSLQFRVAGNKLKKIMHLLEMQRLVQLTSSGPIVLQGDANGTLTPAAQNPRPAGNHGAGYVRPVPVGDSYIYVGAVLNTLYDLKKEILTNDYTATDLTLLSAHLFEGKAIKALCYQERPDSIVWGVLSDGTAFSMTFEAKQEIIGFGRHDTYGGTFEDCCCIRGTDGNDWVHFIVNRNGTRFVEVMADRSVSGLEDQYFVDCGVSYDGRNQDENLVMTVYYTGSGVALLGCSAPVFQASDVGKAFRFRVPDSDDWIDFLISDINTSQVADATFLQGSGEAAWAIPQTTEWSRLTNTIDGLWHLEGQEVSVLADGFVLSNPLNPTLKRLVDGAKVAVDPLTVSNGTVTLFDGYYEVVHAGLPYACDIETLEIDTQDQSQAQRAKNVGQITLKVNRTKGLFFGPKAPDDDTVEGLKRSHNQDDRDVIGTPNVAASPLNDDLIDCKPDGDWNRHGRVFVRQADPLPVEIVGIYSGINL
ncbi:MAG TPA: hypothetical protein VHE12_05800 [bacterium]|nr:hypothetical protein [bacterium]